MMSLFFGWGRYVIPRTSSRGKYTYAWWRDRYETDMISCNSRPQRASVTTRLSMRERCMQELAPYIAPLDSRVPPPSSQRNAIDQMTAKMADRDRRGREKKAQKKLAKLQKKGCKIEKGMQYSAHDQRECSSEGSHMSFSHQPEYSTKEERKRGKAEYRSEKKREEKQEKAERKLGKFREKEDERIAEEVEGIGRMEFLVIENL
jgi:hypothetical protein